MSSNREIDDLVKLLRELETSYNAYSLARYCIGSPLSNEEFEKAKTVASDEDNYSMAEKLVRSMDRRDIVELKKQLKFNIDHMYFNRPSAYHVITSRYDLNKLGLDASLYD